jgi:beta-lactamase regulating signal transducer with metallopeptidase domain/DUF4097 and DUF4098 domain-containing protein YvlB
MSTMAIDLLVRVTLLLGVGALVATLMNRRSAAHRHLLWSASLGGSLALAVLVPWSPRIEIPLRLWPSGIQNVLTLPAAPSVDVPSGTLTNNESREMVLTNEVRADVPSAIPPLWALLWSGGTFAILLWTVFGRLGLAVLTRRGRLVVSGPWRAVVDNTSARLGVSRHIVIYESQNVGAPMTWGIRHPALIVPAESGSWSDALRQSVAAHEVAHVARSDYLTQLLATVACAVYWFHPLAWFVARRMRQAAERACDDQVLALGASGEEYAAHLIGVARVSRQLRLTGAVAIGMARPSTLEGRVVAVLDSARVRSTPTAAAKRLTAIGASLLLILAATVSPVAASPAVLSPAVDNDTSVTTVRGGAAAATEPVVMPSWKVTARSLAAAAQGADSVIDRSFNVSPGGLLTLDLNSGGGVTVRGWDDDRVRVRALLGGINWRDVDVQIERESNGVRIDSRFTRHRSNQSTSNHFEIMVPRRYDVRISSAGGELTLVGLEGRFTGNTGGGELTFERLTGSARITTGGGEITVRDSDLSGSVSTGGGTVRLSNVGGGLRGSSGSGPVVYGESSDRSSRSTTDISSVGISAGGSRITIGRDTEYRSGRLNIEKAGGDVVLDAAPNGAHIRTGGGDVRVGRSAGMIEALTGGGDITIGPVAGSVNTTTGAGDTRIIVDRARGEEQVIEASSGSGRIVIELPSDFDGRLDLETAYTRTHESEARILSDWDLERDPLTDWENRYGTPRRFLRARAVLGRGTGRVVVRTVNAEIEIRRR